MQSQSSCLCQVWVSAHSRCLSKLCVVLNSTTSARDSKVFYLRFLHTETLQVFMYNRVSICEVAKTSESMCTTNFKSMRG